MNPYPPTTHFRVLKPNSDFERDFQVVSATPYVCQIMDSDSKTFTISPLVIGQRRREGKIEVIAFPAHPTHRMQAAQIGGQGTEFIPDQCSNCMIRIDEDHIIHECPLQDPVQVTTQPGPQLEVKDGPGPTSRNHPWRK